ncbi:MAG: SCO family protein [Opitutales bacterium]
MLRCLMIMGGLALSALYSAASAELRGRVLEVIPEEQVLRVELSVVEEADAGDLSAGDTVDFRVSENNIEIGYGGRTIRGKARLQDGNLHLDRIFPLDGDGARALKDVNRKLREATATKSRREYVREGEYIPDFALIDQDGRFVQARQLQGNHFMLNFIFTRCAMPTMCPASTERMAKMQDQAREAGLDDLHFVTITFDPDFDSPAILRQYAEGYDIEPENYRLLTSASPKVIDDLLEQFGILTREEDGTINHTMATLLVDKNGRVAHRKEGSQWEVEAFLEEARDL